MILFALEKKNRNSIKLRKENNMKLNPIKANMTELTLGSGVRILFSYETPVACMYIVGDTQVIEQTEKKWSATTTRHINKWIVQIDSYDKRRFSKMSQEYFDNLIK